MRNLDIIIHGDNGPEKKKVAPNELDFGSSDGKHSMEIEDVYGVYLKEAGDLLTGVSENPDYKPPQKLVKDLTEDISVKLPLSDIDVIRFFMKNDNEGYLSNHTVNVTFLSVMMGKWMKFNPSELAQLTKAAFFHDIGMVQVMGLANQPRNLTQDEKTKINAHPGYSADYLKGSKVFDDTVIQAVYNHHERKNISDKLASDFSQIIGLVDTFEAMTHPRVFRSAKEPHSVLVSFFKEFRDQFDSRVVKALVDNVGIYPSGMWVRIDTDEVALVISTNQGAPLSPKIKILLNCNLEWLPEPRIIDLREQKNIRIVGPVSREEMNHIRTITLSS